LSDAFVSDRETDVRPWGSYVVLDEAEGHKVKRIVVLPHKRLSLQVHRLRSEHWFVVEGSGVVTIGDAVVGVGAGDSVDIAVGTAHRVENTGDSDLVFIEVQHGQSFGEDDIERLDDDFGRVKK
jgi:mannose-6-phosphate isomerase-like protein (cupin superfamily)